MSTKRSPRLWAALRAGSQINETYSFRSRDAESFMGHQAAWHQLILEPGRAGEPHWRSYVGCLLLTLPKLPGLGEVP